MNFHWLPYRRGPAAPSSSSAVHRSSNRPGLSASDAAPPAPGSAPASRARRVRGRAARVHVQLEVVGARPAAARARVRPPSAAAGRLDGAPARARVVAAVRRGVGRAPAAIGEGLGEPGRRRPYRRAGEPPGRVGVAEAAHARSSASSAVVNDMCPGNAPPARRPSRPPRPRRPPPRRPRRRRAPPRARRTRAARAARERRAPPEDARPAAAAPRRRARPRRPHGPEPHRGGVICSGQALHVVDAAHAAEGGRGGAAASARAVRGGASVMTSSARVSRRVGSAVAPPRAPSRARAVGGGRRHGDAARGAAAVAAAACRRAGAAAPLSAPRAFSRSFSSTIPRMTGDATACRSSRRATR